MVRRPKHFSLLLSDSSISDKLGTLKRTWIRPAGSAGEVGWRIEHQSLINAKSSVGFY